MDYDVIIIGAGMSGLGAGIRLAQFDHRVCIIERHSVYGGLNSFYTLRGRRFDVGLHALTNFTAPSVKQAPLARILRQLRIPREALDLCEQHYSQVRFPGHRLRFSNDRELLTSEVARQFPKEVDRFRRLVEQLHTYPDIEGQAPRQSARAVLGTVFRDQLLIDMLLCPLLYYGSAEPNDLDFAQFGILFRSIYMEGLARPRQGVRRIIAELVKRYRNCGGEFRMQCAVQRLETTDSRVTGVVLENGETLTADRVFSSAGYVETMRLCHPTAPRAREGGGDPGVAPQHEVGQLSFMESISLITARPAALGLDATITFYNDSESFTYARPDTLVDQRSGVVCCPNNFERHEDMAEGIIRVTSLANYDLWSTLPATEYVRQKACCYDVVIDGAVPFIPDFRKHVVERDIFTPRTIAQYTGHLNGAVYGSPHKRGDGRTPLQNLYICGTDQGLVGIVGTLLSGIAMANRHVLSPA